MVCIEKDIPLPKLAHPILIPTMTNLVICCTGFDPFTLSEIYFKVRMMGGTVNCAITETVTHLVAGNVGSEKYHVAVQHKIPIMMPEWVHKCFEESHRNLIHALDLREFW